MTEGVGGNALRRGVRMEMGERREEDGENRERSTTHDSRSAIDLRYEVSCGRSERTV